MLESPSRAVGAPGRGGGAAVMPVRKGNYHVGKAGPVIAGMKIGDEVLCEEVGVSVASFWSYVAYHCLPIKFKSRKTREGIRVRRIA